MNLLKKMQFFLKFKKKKSVKLFKKLENANWNNTSPFIPNLTFGKVIKVYDVDTITIVAKPYKDSIVSRFSVRLANVDGPEITAKNIREKEAALKARDILKDKVLNQYVILTDIKIDKYGRYLCNVWLNDVNINKWLLDEHLVVKYFGGKKESPTDWLDYFDGKKSETI